MGLVTGLFICFNSIGLAANITWNNAGADWSTGANWTGNLAPADNTTTDVAVFATVTQQPVLNFNRSVNGIIFNGPSATTLSGAGILTLGGGGVTNFVGVLTTEEKISTALALASPLAFNNFGNLTITGNITSGGTLLTLNGTGGRGSISGQISGTRGLTKTGNGTWTLTGQNSFTGPVEIQDGILSANSLAPVGALSSALGAPASILNGTIKLGSGNTTGSLVYTGANQTTDRIIDLSGTTGGGNLSASGAGALTLTSNLTTSGVGAKLLTLSGNNTANNTFAGAISNSANGSISVLKTDIGTWVLGGANTFSGGLTLTGGMLIAGNATALGNGALVLNGGTLAADAARIVGNTVSLSASSTIGGNSNLTLTGTITNTLAGDATLTVSNTGTTTLAAIVLSNSTTSRKLTLNNSGNVSVTGIISNGGNSTLGSLTKSGAGTLTLSAASTYGGNTTLAGGTLVAGNNTAFGTSTLILGGAGVTLRGDGNARTLSNPLTQLESCFIGGTSNLTFSNTLSVTSNGTPVLNVNNTGLTSLADIACQNTNLRILNDGELVVTGYIVGINFLKSGAGNLTLLAQNYYGGCTTISAGTVIVSHGNALGTTAGGTGVANGAALHLQNNITVSGESLSLAGTGSNSTGALRNRAGNNTWTGNIALASAVQIQSDSDRLTLAGSITGNGQSLTITGSGNTTVAGSITTSTGSLTKSGSGSLALSGSNTFSGGTALSAGSLILGHSLALQSSTLTLADGAALAFADIETATLGGLAGAGNFTLRNNLAAPVTLSVGTNNASTTFSGTLSGPGGIVKTGTGSLTLSGANTYNGTTTLSSGTLIAGGNSSFGTGPLTIINGTLGGSGSPIVLGNPVNIGQFLYFTGSSNLTFTGPMTNTSASYMNLRSTSSGSTTFSDINLSSSTTNQELLFSGTGIFYVNGVIANGGTSTVGSLRISNSGTILSGANTYGGLTKIEGTLIIENNQALGSNSTGTEIINVGSLQLRNNITVTSEVLSIASSNSASLRNLSGNNTWTGDITTDGSQYTQSDAGTLFLLGSFTSGGNYSRLNFQGSGNIVIAGNITGTASNMGLYLSGTGNTTISGGIRASQMNLFLGTNALISGNISIDSGSLSKTGLTTVTLSGANNYNGNTTLSAGTLVLGSPGALGGNGTIFLTGGTLKFSAANTNDYSDRFSTAANQQYRFDTNGQNVTFATGLSSLGASILKLGAGTLFLNGANTYTGNTTIASGVLSFAFPSLNPASDVNLLSGSVLDLNFAGTATVDELFINGIRQKRGVWSALGGNGTFTTSQITGSGTLTVTSGPPSFQSYIATYFTQSQITAGAPVAATADPDADGFNNLLEYAFDLNPVVADLSPVSLDAGSGFLTLTYPRRTDDINADLIYTVEVSSDLVNWFSGPGYTQELSSVPVVGTNHALVTVRDLTAFASSTPRFIRVQCRY